MGMKAGHVYAHHAQFDCLQCRNSSKGTILNLVHVLLLPVCIFREETGPAFINIVSPIYSTGRVVPSSVLR
uniref:Uncharacterized protein n=1 Tax=Anguilla anguilla TaxID=7936 RepID=A0A0E9X2G1_ANGAN